MLDLEVKLPERSIKAEKWNIELGMPLFQVVKVLKRQQKSIDVVNFHYNKVMPFNDNLVLNLENNGLNLVFNAKHQRLNYIEVFDLTKVKLRYRSTYFNNPSITKPTLSCIQNVFGSTEYPSEEDSEYKVLRFKGIHFHLPLDDPLRTKNMNKLVKKVFIFSGENFEKEGIPPEIPLVCYHGNFFADSISAVWKDNLVQGLEFKLRSAIIDNEIQLIKKFETRTLKFGQTVQEVMCEIGSPCQTFYKSQDKMTIHSSRKYDQEFSDYFFNYFTLGIDILFDGLKNTVKKFVLHSNHPNHYNFNIYYRCLYNIKLPIDSPVITACTSWNEVKKSLGSVDKPVVLNRASSGNNDNPFGRSECYGIYNMIFEVMENKYLANVTVYQNPVKEL